MSPAANVEYLEYGEDDEVPDGSDDLFGSDDEQPRHSRTTTSLQTYNRAVPIPSSSSASSSLMRQSIGNDTKFRSNAKVTMTTTANPRIMGSSSRDDQKANNKGKSKAKESVVGVKDIQVRMNELSAKKRGRREGRASKGVTSLRSACMAIIKANSSRIWDVGEMEYPLIADFINDLPMEQLAAIEEACPHIKKDSDWLWEYFILQDYPLFHERCNERQGEARTSGWRRMYKKAREDAEERKLHAADRLAQRYKQLEEEKSAKKVVFVNQVTVPQRGKSARGNGTTGMRVATKLKGPALPSVQNSRGALAKARQDSQRARIAITHASGKYVPGSSASNSPSLIGSSTTSQGGLYKNPYLDSAPTPAPAPGYFIKPKVDAPRLPPPRAKSKQDLGRSAPPLNPSSSPSPSKSPFAGSYPSSKAQEMRSALPLHLVKHSHPHPNPSDEPSAPPAKRPKWEDKSERLKPFHKATVQNFDIPEEKKQKGPMMDFFNPGRYLDDQKKREEEVQVLGETHPKEKVTGPSPGGISKSPSNAISSEEAARISSVLFRKKPKPKAKVAS